jgi:hypothetical protein
MRSSRTGSLPTPPPSVSTLATAPGPPHHPRDHPRTKPDITQERRRQRRGRPRCRPGARAGPTPCPAAAQPPGPGAQRQRRCHRRVRLAPAPASAAVLGRVADRRPRPPGRPRPARGGMDASGRRRRPAAGWRLGRRGHRVAGFDRLAAGHPSDLPQGTPHPGARPRFVDPDGNRYQVFATDQPDRDLARLELRHRRHARVEDRIRAAKATGLANLPFDAWRRNAVRLELVQAAQDLTAGRRRCCWTASWRWPSQAAAHPAAAHRRPAGCPRPPADPAPAGRLAMGSRAGDRVRPASDAASNARLTFMKPRLEVVADAGARLVDAASPLTSAARAAGSPAARR